MTIMEDKSAFVQAFTHGINGGSTRRAAETVYALAMISRGEGENIMENTVSTVCNHCFRELLVVPGDSAARCPFCGYTFSVPAALVEPGNELATGTDG